MVNDLTLTLMESNTYEAVSTSVGLVAILLLLSLLAAKELIRASARPGWGGASRLNVGIVPLLIASTTVIALRLLNLVELL